MTKDYELAVTGMTCSACAVRLERQLNAADGIIKANVSLAMERAIISVDSKLATVNDLVQVIKRTGFNVVTEQITLHVNKGDTDKAKEFLENQSGVLAVTVNDGQLNPKVISLAVTSGLLVDELQKQGIKATTTESSDTLPREQTQATRELWIVAIAVLVTSPFLIHMLIKYLDWSGKLHFHLSPIIEMALATVAQFGIGLRFYRAAYNALRGGSANMDVLVALGTSVAYFYSLYLWISLGAQAKGQLFFEASAMIITLVLVGKFMEQRAKRGASKAIRELLALRPKVAYLRMPDGTIAEREISKVQLGDIIVCRPGGQVAVDGVIVKGTAEIDESLISGESVPIAKRFDDQVTGGSININGVIDIEATAVGGNSTLAKMIKMVEHAQVSKPAVQKLVDRVCAYFVPTVVAIAVITFFGWLMAGAELGDALIYATAVLVIACPCALGLATPTAIMTGSGAAARAGILIKDTDALERAHRLSYVIFDKTGTLTHGKPRMQGIELFGGLDEDQVLQLAASLQQGSEHPIALSLREAAQARGLNLLDVSDFEALVSRGVTGYLNGDMYLLGNTELFLNKDVCPPPRELAGGGTEVWLGVSVKGGNALLARFEIVDVLRDEARPAVQQLDKLNVKSLLVSGDATPVTQKIADQLAIAEAYGEVRPEGKSEIVDQLVARGGEVGMVGDGINDAPALAKASVGIAMGGGTDIAMESATITLMRSDPRLVAAAIEASRRTFRKIKQNLFWAFIYNVIGIPLAAFGLLSPALAGAAMACSSITVITNSLMLRSWRPKLD